MPGDATEFLAALFEPATLALRVNGRPVEPLRSEVKNVGAAEGEDHWLVTLVAGAGLPFNELAATVVLEAGNAQATFVFEREPGEVGAPESRGVVEFVRRLSPRDFE